MNVIGQILTHGFELANQLLLGPLGPLLLVCVDGAQYWPTWLTTILYGWNIQVVDKHNIRVLEGKRERERKRETERLVVGRTLFPIMQCSQRGDEDTGRNAAVSGAWCVCRQSVIWPSHTQ